MSLACPLHVPFLILMRIELLYGAPVLLSGVSSLVLNKAETMALHHHYKLPLLKATVQAKLLSGFYRTSWLSRHWSSDPSGSCSLPHCHLNGPTPGTLQHILLHCEDLVPARVRVASLWTKTLLDKPSLASIVDRFFSSCENEQLVIQFLLDCSTLPEIVKARQAEGPWVMETLFYMTRTFCFSLHVARLRLLGKWNYK